MILERLLDFHDAQDRIIPAALKAQRVRWFLDIDEDGRFLGLSETGAKRKEWKELIAPYAKRSGSQPPPFLLVDKPDYVLGHVAEAEKLSATKQEQEQAKANDRHAEYVAITQACAKDVTHPALDAFVGFLDSQLNAARAQAAQLAMKSGDLIAPRVGHQILTDLPAVRRFWQAQQDEAAVEKSNLNAECLVTGKVGPIARTHPVELLVGPNRVGLVSANENAFLSYGLQQSEIAPMSFTAARKYGEALRHLLFEDQHNIRVAGVTWVYWTREETEADPLIAVKTADPDEVEKLLQAPRVGQPRAALEANDFYALAVSANTSRMVVRSWITTSLAEVQENIRLYFERMRLLDRDGQPRYHKHTALAGALVREFKDLPDHVAPDLLNTALWRRPLPLSLLHQALQRARADEHVITHPRAALIKLVLLSNPSLAERYPMSDQLSPDHPHPAYQCGRLLALLDRIQRKAINPNATVVDRFYGSASSAPASVMGVLLNKARPHLAKLRKKRGKEDWLEWELGKIMAGFDPGVGFPRTLKLEEQGLFAIGFYQERNRIFEKDDDSSDANDAAANIDLASSDTP